MNIKVLLGQYSTDLIDTTHFLPSQTNFSYLLSADIAKSKGFNEIPQFLHVLFIGFNISRTDFKFEILLFKLPHLLQINSIL